MMDIRIATKEDIDDLMCIRLEMLKVVNQLSEKDNFLEELVENSRDYFLNGSQTTVLAYDNGKQIGCASISYIRVMPTFSHPTGMRAHLMNVYTRKEYRRRGIARQMVSMLMEESWERGVSEISLDTTAKGRKFYESLGFQASSECMVLTRKV